MATKTKTPKLIQIDEHEGNGHCGSCGRENLRWVCVFDDGSQVGSECAKGLLGYKPTAKDYKWRTDYTKVADYTYYGDNLTLWEHKRNPRQTAEARNGMLQGIGYKREDWAKNGWL